MKRLILIRHAKSSWKYPELTDFERPLNKRGKRDAPFMAHRMQELGYRPDQLISSPAERAKTTAGIFAEAWGLSSEQFSLEPALYEAWSSRLLHQVHDLSEEWNTVALVGHNPGFTSLLNSLSTEYLDNLPTCGVYGIEFAVSRWEDVRGEEGRRWFYEYPKLYFKRKP